MNRHRIPIIAAAGLCAALWTYACGDGATEPSTPPPDPPQPTTVTVSPATAQLAALGATVQLSAEVRDQNGNAMAGATVTWASSAAATRRDSVGCEGRRPSRLSGNRFARNRTTPLRLSSSRPVRAPESPVIRSRRDPILIDLLKLNAASIIFTPGVMVGECWQFF